jgi:hypothetical protein
MRYTPTPDELAAVEHVRDKPSLYLSPGRTTTPRDIALELANDAIYLEATQVEIRRFEDWYLVASPTDWVTLESRRTSSDVFFRPQLFHKYRQNATRATILPVAFAQDVVTYAESSPTIIAGCDAIPDELTRFVESNLPAMRVVAFRGQSHGVSA